MVTKYFWTGLVALLALFLFASIAAADPPRELIVVELGPGTRLDAASLRAEIGTELGVEAIAPDDPRAPHAKGRVWIEPQPQGGARVTFRRMGEPISRVLELPPDATEATRSVVLLAGNLARDEAADLLGSDQPPPKPKPKPRKLEPPKPPAPTAPDYDAQLAQMSDLMRYFETRHDALPIAVGVTELALGAAMLPSGIYMLTHHSAEAGGLLTIAGANLAGTGGLTLIIGVDDDLEDLAKAFKKRRRRGVPAAEILADTEADWWQRAERARARRTAFGIVGIVVGTAAIGIGTYSALRVTDSGSTRARGDALAGLAIGSGALVVGLSVYRVMLEDPIELTYVAYRQARPQLSVRVPKVGAAPLPGGALLTVTGRF